MNGFDNYNNNNMFDLQQEDDRKRKLQDIMGSDLFAQQTPIFPVEQTIAKQPIVEPVSQEKKPKEVNREINQAAKTAGIELTPEVKKQVKQDWSKYDQEIGEAKNRNDKANKLLYIIEAASGMFTAGTGARPDSQFYESLRQENRADTESVKAKKLQAIKEFQMQQEADRIAAQEAESKRRYEEDKALDKEKFDWQKQNAENERKAKKEDRQFELKLRAQDKADAKQEKQLEKMQELSINYGGNQIVARTPSDAKELKEGISGADKAIKDLSDVKELGKNVSVFDRTKVGLIQQKLMTAIGGLRLSVLGPGVMTDSERTYLRENIGDPSSLFSTEGIENAKLDQLIKQIEDSKVREINLRSRGAIPNDQTQQVQQPQIKNEVERVDPKTGKIAIFDADTKQFIRWK